MTKKTPKENTKVKELEQNWKRALADYTNLEKRIEEEKKQIVSFSNEILVGNLLPVLDGLEQIETQNNEEGLKLTIKEFKKVLKNAGLTEIETKEKEFDPNTMEALEIIKGKKNEVIETAQKGYFLKDKLIRPARVKVGKGGK